MKKMHVVLASLGFVIAVICLHSLAVRSNQHPSNQTQIIAPSVVQVATNLVDVSAIDDESVPAFVDKGLQWLADAQFESGGWGAGSHARQDIVNPNAVQIDPATTAFSAMALIRAGNTLNKGPYQKHVRRAVQYMVELVESYPEEGPNITDISGTQPQAKLGQNIDVSMAAQLFTRVLPLLEQEPRLEQRVQDALKVCLDKLARSQSNDGSWNDRGGWAAVLQSAMANNAFEMADEAGISVDEEVLEKSRAYQRSNIDSESGAVRTESAAGISLYSIASNQRATAKAASTVQKVMDQARREGRLDARAEPSVDNLQQLGFDADEAKKMADSYKQNEITRQMLKDDSVLAGFGNNGGEEFLSFMMTSESLVVTGGKDWEAWYTKMYNLLSHIQNEDGSWSGHHCITSPVFCTAAVVMAMLAERDLSVLKAQQASQGVNG